MWIDLHCDTISALEDGRSAGGLKGNTLCVDARKLRQGEVAAQFFALFVDAQKCVDPLRAVLKLLDRFYRELEENRETLAFAGNYADLAQNQIQGKISAFLTIEEGESLGGSLENLRNFYRLGVRLLTLTWNHPNALGFPNHRFTYADQGLTDFGKATVEEMNRIGMIVDVSHLSDAGFDDVVALSKKPVVASHSNSRAMTPHYRNLPDDKIRRLAENGGVMGINFARQFLGNSLISRIDDMVRHILHIRCVGGIDVLALGADFDGTDPTMEIAHCGELGKLVAALEKAGLSADEIERICYKNTLRVIKECL